MVPLYVRRLSLMSVALLFCLPLALPAAAEGPTQYSCDPSGTAVCAGSAVGGNVVCDEVIAATVDCDYTYGWIAGGLSRLFLPGEARAAATYTIEACSSMSGCTQLDQGAWEDDCAWGGATNACTIGGDGAGSYRGVPLALGECVTVLVTVAIEVDAQVLTTDLLPPHATAHHERTGSEAGQVCHLDNGRGD